MSQEETGWKAAKLLGIHNKGATTGLNVETNIHAPTTAWEIYNNRAATYDKELIKDWNDSLNTLLVFVNFIFTFDPRIEY